MTYSGYDPFFYLRKVSLCVKFYIYLQITVFSQELLQQLSAVFRGRKKSHNGWIEPSLNKIYYFLTHKYSNIVPLNKSALNKPKYWNSDKSFYWKYVSIFRMHKMELGKRHQIKQNTQNIIINPVSIYLLKVNNRNTWTRCEIRSLAPFWCLYC